MTQEYFGPLPPTNLIRDKDKIWLQSQRVHAPEEWNDLTLVNSWANYLSTWPSAQYRKLASGMVELQGMVDTGAVNTVIATLPTDYRPDTQQLFLCAASGGHWRVDVQTDGDIVCHATEGTGTPGTWLNLGQIRVYLT